MIVFLALSLVPFLFAQESAQPTGESAKGAGKWQLTWQGVMGTKHGSLQIQQDGTQLSGTVDRMPLIGTVNGDKVSFSFEPRQGMRLTLNGTVDGDRMSGTTGRGRSWTATRQQ
jgi:hypothetical protein